LRQDGYCVERSENQVIASVLSLPSGMFAEQLQDMRLFVWRM
jgi:hypothetical protein